MSDPFDALAPLRDWVPRASGPSVRSLVIRGRRRRARRAMATVAAAAAVATLLVVAVPLRRAAPPSVVSTGGAVAAMDRRTALELIAAHGPLADAPLGTIAPGVLDSGADQAGPWTLVLRYDGPPLDLVCVVLRRDGDAPSGCADDPTSAAPILWARQTAADGTTMVAGVVRADVRRVRVRAVESGVAWTVATRPAPGAPQLRMFVVRSGEATTEVVPA